jgi:asparagine N-glycosylation enzyme membrane subunit Stt3
MSEGRSVTIERRARVNRTQGFLGALAVVVLGLFAPGWFGATVLFALVGALFVLLTRTARRSPPGTVAIRLVILVGLVVIAVVKVT